MSAASAGHPILSFDSKEAWATWLHEHHSSEAGVRLRLARAGSLSRSVSHKDALDVALCYGWIDGQAERYDDESWLLRFTPRGKRSSWSKRNRENVERLIASGEMQRAGLAAIEAAKADGRWDRAYDSPRTATIPDDFRTALDDHSEARKFFAELTSANRYAILYRIQTAVKPETRARRIAQFIAMLERRETLNK
jgi:uncharacterized protein YdeI (YjbR/CyaY-like superfamily)